MQGRKEKRGKRVKRNIFYKLLLFIEILRLHSIFTRARFDKTMGLEKLHDLACELDRLENELKDII